MRISPNTLAKLFFISLLLNHLMILFISLFNQKFPRMTLVLSTVFFRYDWITASIKSIYHSLQSIGVIPSIVSYNDAPKLNYDRSVSQITNKNKNKNRKNKKE